MKSVKLWRKKKHNCTSASNWSMQVICLWCHWWEKWCLEWRLLLFLCEWMNTLSFWFSPDIIDASLNPNDSSFWKLTISYVYNWTKKKTIYFLCVGKYRISIEIGANLFPLTNCRQLQFKFWFKCINDFIMHPVTKFSRSEKLSNEMFAFGKISKTNKTRNKN